MAGVNKVILIEHLGADPEIKHLEDTRVANISLATTESYKDRQGNKVEQTEWHSLEIWGKLAEIAEQYLKKGSKIYVEGKIKSDTWEDQDGNKRKKTKIRVSSFVMLGGKQEEEQKPAQQPAPSVNHSSMASNASTQTASSADFFDVPTEDQLPF